ncbi:MAG TPA: putative lipopolysaccharide heptosyltransferase III [Casimicrobiaceae bacterium]|nr:putative lipopolysaccharide heptosyltransferase III [Casimicrobiaceae bacterium]
MTPLADAVDLDRVQRALVIKLRHHGDVLLTSPVFTTLKRAAPHMDVDALVYLETAPMLANHPAIAELHTIDRAWKRAGLLRQIGAERALLARLRARRYDLIVHLTEHPRGATLTRLLRPRYAVARERSDAGRWWRRTFTHQYRLPRATPRHAVEANLDALRRIGVYPAPADKPLVLVPDAAAGQAAEALLRAHGLERGAFVQCHPGSRWLFKCWPAEKTAALLDRIVRSGHAVIVTGAPDARERALVTEILAAIAPESRPRVFDATGMLSLDALAALTARARAFVGVDSAPMHIAAAMQVPVIALFGPSGDLEWGPWMVPHRVIVSDEFPCRPCGIDGCGGGKVSECLTTLDIDRVANALFELLARTRVT